MDSIPFARPSAFAPRNLAGHSPGGGSGLSLSGSNFVMATEPADRAKSSAFFRLLREPTLHFFAIAAAALLVQRAMVGDLQTIELTPALETDLLRRYHDQMGRAATPAEAEA